MQYPVSDKISTLKPSAIREIFKYAGLPGVISLSAGTPAAETLPVELLARFCGEILQQEPVTALSYSQSEGHPPFRNALKDYLRGQGSFCEYDDLIVTSGAQQCMDLITKVLCNEHDTIICETPSFIGSLNAFRSYNTNIVGVPLEEDGICLEKLEAALRENKNVRFIYLIPNFQNPTGITMSLQKRRACLALAKKYNVPILEDNPYGDLRFTGESLPTIKSMDTDGIVLYAGTFSKILSSGMRVGYMVAPAEIMGKLVVAKQCTDVHTSMLAQLCCYRFLSEVDMAEHLRTLSKVYSRKCGLMLAEMEKQFPQTVSWPRPEGGMFIWVTLPGSADSAPFVTELVRDYKIAVVPGAAFAVREGELSSSFRLNFSTPADEQIVEGIARIGKAFAAQR